MDTRQSGVIPNQITAMTYMYAPQLGYHVQVPYNASTTPSLEIPGFSFQAMNAHVSV